MTYRVVAPPSAGCSAARIFTALKFGPRICHEAPNDVGASEFKTLVAGFKAAQDKVKEIAEQALSEAKRSNGVTEQTKIKADEALTAMNTKSAELDGRLIEVEQRMARRGGPVAEQVKSLGEHVVGNDAVKAILEHKSGKAKVSIETKTILSATGTWGSGVSPSSSLVAADRQAMVALPQRPLVVRDLLAPGQTVSNAIEYPQQASFTNNAAVVAENTTKPLSDLAFDLKTANVRTIAHRMLASRQILDDAPQLQSFIDSQMRYGLAYAEEAELLNGDGTGQHLLGIIPQATAYSAPFVLTGETVVDRLRLAYLQGSLALYPMSGIVLNPVDWTKIETIKDGMGRYLIGDPQGTVAPRLWGLPVAASLAMTAGSYLVGAFKYGAQIFDRMAVEVLISTEDNDNFSKNMVTIRAEERLALAVYRPGAFITGTLP